MAQHPYAQYEGSVLWEAVRKAIDELEENRDLRLTTRKEYVIGYLVKALAAPQTEPGG